MGKFSSLREQFKTFADVSITQEAYVNELNFLKNKETLSLTEQVRYNELISYLSQNMVSAHDINNIQHAIENIETFLDNQPLYFRGEYSNSNTYNLGDIVYYEGSAYVCMINSTKGIVPTNNTNWHIFVKQGLPSQLIIQRNSVTINTSIATVDIGINNFDKSSDILMVYQNGMFLNEGTDYNINSDSTKIIKNNGTWNGASDYNIIFDFCVYKQIYTLDSGVADGYILYCGNASSIRG